MPLSIELGVTKYSLGSASQTGNIDSCTKSDLTASSSHKKHTIEFAVSIPVIDSKIFSSWSLSLNNQSNVFASIEQIQEYWRLVSTSSILMQEKKLQILESLISFNGSGVGRYLRSNIILIDLLLERVIEIRQYFPSSPLQGEITIDPEAVRHNADFVLSILTDLPYSSAHEKLEEFDDNWWVDRVSETGGSLIIRLEFT